MTKKSKKKAIKTGLREKDGPRVTTFDLSSNIQKDTTIPVNVNHDEEQEDEEIIDDSIERIILSKSRKKQLKKQELLEVEEAYLKMNNLRKHYHIDLWFLISSYIRPEDVQAFSCICRSSYLVTHTKKFWLNIYIRFVNGKSNVLPSHLKANAITTNIGLKARVVRSLYFDYEPLKSSVMQITPILEAPSNVENRICKTYWWRQVTSSKRNIKIWMFYFKILPYGVKQSNIFKQTDLIQFNSEEDASLLRVVSPSYIKLPNPSGLCLTGVNISVSRDMRHHKLKLIFHEYRHSKRYINSQALNIIIEPVFDVHVLNWWHPDYPHPVDH